MEKQTDWIGSRAGARPGDPTLPDMERLRKDLESYKSSEGNWEAECLKSVADLLDSLERARSEQRTLNRRLADLHTQLETESEQRQRLKDKLVEWDSQQVETERVTKERDELASNLEVSTARLAASRQEAEALTQKLEQSLVRVTKIEAERDEWNAALEKVRAGQAALESAQLELEKLRAERDELKVRVERLEKEQTETRKANREASRQHETLQDQCEKLNRRAEQNLVELCDLRVQVNRLENERDDAVDERRKKVKKVLGKVHAALDEAGAPRGDDLSFGERIRWLKQQAESSDDLLL